MKQYYYCNASVRVKECRLSTNLCCCVCSYNEECRKIAGRIKPCQLTDFAEDEACEFLI